VEPTANPNPFTFLVILVIVIALVFAAFVTAFSQIGQP
jgi:hypothetical protein